MSYRGPMNRRSDEWYARFRQNVMNIQKRFGIELTFMVGQSGDPFVRLPPGKVLSHDDFMRLKRAFRLVCMLYNPRGHLFFYYPDVCLKPNSY